MNKEKPSGESIEKYCAKLEEYLSAHDIKIRIECYETPAVLTSTIGGFDTKKEVIWFSRLVIDTPSIKGIELTPSRFSIDEALEEWDIWEDAWDIQNQMFKYFYPKEASVYIEKCWKLWEKIENKGRGK